MPAAETTPVAEHDAEDGGRERAADRLGGVGETRRDAGLAARGGRGGGRRAAPPTSAPEPMPAMTMLVSTCGRRVVERQEQQVPGRDEERRDDEGDRAASVRFDSSGNSTAPTIIEIR